MDPEIDLNRSGAFYDAKKDEWTLGESAFFRFIYEKAPKPAIFLSVAALVWAVVTWVRQKSPNREALYLALVMIIGPGILINAVLKPEWGRPRPREIQNFGGEQKYERLWEYDPSSDGKSFPSGHASMGFYFFAVAFLLYRRGNRWAWAGFAGALAFGILLGATRVIQGGHFLSDVIWSAAICWFVAVLLLPLVPRETEAIEA